MDRPTTIPAQPRSAAGFRAGARDLAGAFIAVVAFGIGFGAAAVTAGMTPTSAVVMSAVVFAGASQYAVLDLWQAPLSLLAVAGLTLAVNARHLVFGATLRSYFALHPPTSRYGALALLSDANWAATQQAIAGGERRLGYFVGGGAMLWIAWVIGTGVGAFAGDAVGDPARFGLDAIMPAFFVCSLIAMARDRTAVPAWLVAAGATAGLSLVMPSQWSILLGSVGGAATGLLRDE